MGRGDALGPGLAATATGWAMAAAVAVSACAAPQAGTPLGSPAPVSTLPGGSAVDSLRGTVAVVGAEPLTRVVLQTAAGEQLRLEGDLTPLLQRVDGLEVLVEGRLEKRGLQVTSFRVVGASGVPAADGYLELEAGAAVLVGTDGVKLRFTPVPRALRGHAGHRVWIAGAPGGEPVSWGVIDPH